LFVAVGGGRNDIRRTHHGCWRLLVKAA